MILVQHFATVALKDWHTPTADLIPAVWFEENRIDHCSPAAKRRREHAFRLHQMAVELLVFWWPLLGVIRLNVCVLVTLR